MKALKVFVAIGIAATLTGGLAACGTPYSGEGVVVDKEIEKQVKASSSKKKSSSKSKDYEITVDVPNSDANRTIDVSKSKYESIKVGQTVTIENGKIK